MDGLSTIKHDSFVAKTFPGILKETTSQLKKSQPALFFKPATSAIDWTGEPNDPVLPVIKTGNSKLSCVLSKRHHTVTF